MIIFLNNGIYHSIGCWSTFLLGTLNVLKDNRKPCEITGVGYSTAPFNSNGTITWGHHITI